MSETRVIANYFYLKQDFTANKTLQVVTAKMYEHKTLINTIIADKTNIAKIRIENHFIAKQFSAKQGIYEPINSIPAKHIEGGCVHT